LIGLQGFKMSGEVTKLKKDLWVKLAGLAIVLTLISSSLVSGTYAKYVKSVTGADTARVAKFAFALKEGASELATQATDSEATFSIFDYTDTGVYNDGVNGTSKFIAPGTTGSFELLVQNLSEVDVAVTMSASETNASSIPVYYTIGAEPQRYSNILTGTYTGDGGGTYKTLADLGTDLGTAAGTLQATDNSTATEKTVKINWTWAFTADAQAGQSDEADTSLGITGTATVKLSVQVTMTQADT